VRRRPTPQSYACLYYHLIFSTKERRPLLSAALRPRLYDYMGSIIRNDQGILVAAGGTADHVHLLASISKDRSVSVSLRDVKAYSSRWIHETFPDLQEFAWQSGYGAFTVGHSGLDKVKSYVRNQAAHHRTLTFQEEFVTFLERYGVPYDERYIWA
jgi:putative transposase